MTENTDPTPTAENDAGLAARIAEVLNVHRWKSMGVSSVECECGALLYGPDTLTQFPADEAFRAHVAVEVTRVLPPGQCPDCGEPVYVAAKWGEWACSDPECVRAHGPGPGGGYVIPPGKGDA